MPKHESLHILKRDIALFVMFVDNISFIVNSIGELKDAWFSTTLGKCQPACEK